MNLRPLGPEPAPGEVLAVGGVGRPSQALDDTGVARTDAVEGLPQNPTNGGDGNASADRVAADLRRTEFMRPEGLLPVSAVAERLGISVSTVHEAINAGKLRCILFGSVRRVRLEDLDAYVQSQSASRPPADEDWCTVAELMLAARVSRPQAYRLLTRGMVPFEIFAGVRYIRSTDIDAFVRGQGKASHP